MFNKSTYISDPTLVLDRRTGDAGLLHRRPPDTGAPATHHHHAAEMHQLDSGWRDRDRLARAEWLMLASIWLGSAAAVLVAVVELVRSA